ncbi:MAG: GNAT family N-acetyltransferase [Ignavibacteriae bacterium]|nr:GNAT family N-acetyltransferase [Ignavibacteriota bacterium]
MNSIRYILKKTIDLNEDDLTQLKTLTKEIYDEKKDVREGIINFNENKFIEKLLHFYTKNILGYSFHSLAYKNNTIIGHIAFTPFQYSYFGKEITIALAANAMIQKKERNFVHFKKIFENAFNNLKINNFPFALIFPNDNAYLLYKKLFGFIDLGELKYYILPVKIANIIKINNLWNYFSIFLCKLLNIKLFNLNFIIRNKDFNIQKLHDENFYDYRYSKIMGDYITHSEEKYFYSYIIKEFNSTVTLFLIDIVPLSKKNMQEVIRTLYKKHKDSIDIIIYIGSLNFHPLNLIKVPKKFEPKTEHSVGIILDYNIVDDRIYNIKNWNLNLSNFDII